MTPELLGNFTYGYIGAALGLPLGMLYFGSWYAAGFPMPWGDDWLVNERWDWMYIAQGYLSFDSVNYQCMN